MRVAYLVLALSLIPTAVVYFRVRIECGNARRGRGLSGWCRRKQAAIEQRIPHYVEEMLGSSGPICRQSIRSPLSNGRNISTAIEIQRLYPGIRTLGYLERVDAEDKDAFLDAIRVRQRSCRYSHHAGRRPAGLFSVDLF